MPTAPQTDCCPGGQRQEAWPTPPPMGDCRPSGHRSQRRVKGSRYWLAPHGTHVPSVRLSCRQTHCSCAVAPSTRVTKPCGQGMQSPALVASRLEE